MARWFACIVAWLALGTLFAVEAPIDLPEGYELAEIHPSDWRTPPFLTRMALPATPLSTVGQSALDAFPSTLIAGCVNAISGHFLDSEIDLLIPGPVPLVVQRHYCSGTGRWRFRHMPHLRVAPSQGEHHLEAYYRDDDGSGMGYRAPLKEHLFCIPGRLFRTGFTNCSSGEISGQTNWKNSWLSFVRQGEAKRYLLRHPAHIDRLFERYDKRVKHQHGAPTGFFRLVEERHPNGNRLLYDYTKDHSLTSIAALNQAGKRLWHLRRHHLLPYEVRWEHDAGDVIYRWKDKTLTIVASIQHPRRTYTYDQVVSRCLVKKELPEGRFLLIDYEDDEAHRVRQLRAPVGDDQTPHVTHRFAYGHRCTHVWDGRGLLTQYHFHPKHKRLEKIVRYDAQHHHVTEERFTWGRKNSPFCGQLLSRLFIGKGKPLFCRQLRYDGCGNIVEERLWGRITGKKRPPLAIDETGQPIENGCEVYTKYSRATQDRWHLPLEEWDGRKRVTCSYVPRTNLIQCRFTGSAEHVLKREFFAYDENGVVIYQSWDDGEAKEEGDLTGVTERHVVHITPTREAPIGLPAVVEEWVLDVTTGQYDLLKRQVNAYTPSGQLTSQAHYGSDGCHAYTLTWEYDAHGNKTREVNALGDVTTWRYDANDNKIYEKRASGDVTRWTYDYSNRLIREEVIGADEITSITSHAYHLLGERVKSTDPYGQVTRFTYDMHGRVVKQRFPPIETAEGKRSPIERNAYNPLGHRIAHWDREGHCTRTWYTIRGQPTRIAYPDGSIERKRYTLDGLLAEEVAKNGAVTSYKYDPFGRVIRTTIRSPNGEVLQKTSATYNAFHLLSETDAAGICTTYQYDLAGRKSRVHRGNRVTTYRYDALGRQVEEREWIDEQQARINRRQYDLLDRVIEERIESENGILFHRKYFGYDRRGHKTTTTLFPEAGESAIRKEYNSLGDLIAITDPLGHITHFTYDRTSVLTTTKTDPAGQQEIKQRDSHGQVRCLIRKDPFGTVIHREDYAYDQMGRRTVLHLTLYSGEKPLRTATTHWAYDAMGREMQCIECQNSEQPVPVTLQRENGRRFSPPMA